MKRAGFTMIELIFVIVILGILAAVALPKFIGVSEQAEAGKCKAFIGTLNRTVAPAIWSDMVLNDKNETAAFATGTITTQIDIPTECTGMDEAALLGATLNGAAFAVTVGDGAYEVNASAPSRTVSPIWTWIKTN